MTKINAKNSFENAGLNKFNVSSEVKIALVVKRDQHWLSVHHATTHWFTDETILPKVSAVL